MSELSIRPARAGDEPAWRELWAGYCEFYGVDVAPDVTAATWERVTGDSPMSCLVAERGGRVVGFAHFLLHPSTWSRVDSCYLEDLFVAPDARRGGVARALVEALAELARERGWRHVYWHTQGDNHPARALYDSLVAADGYVRYVLRP